MLQGTFSTSPKLQIGLSPPLDKAADSYRSQSHSIILPKQGAATQQTSVVI
jgi:hypothetical protein